MDNGQFLLLCQRVQIIPVLVIENEKMAVPVASILIEAGFSAIEVTLRSQAAWNAAKIIKNSCKGVTVGMGSILSPSDMERTVREGMDFCVSPGMTPALLDTAKKHNIPYLPGVSTVSEVLTVREYGFHFLKFFPAALSGGIDFIKAIGGPVKDTFFCPTGGVRADNFSEYLSVEKVACVGGTWLATKADFDSNDLDSIRKKAAQASLICQKK